MRWLAVRLDIVSIALITTTGLMIILMHGQIPPAYAGLAISYAVQVNASFACQNKVAFWNSTVQLGPGTSALLNWFYITVVLDLWLFAEQPVKVMMDLPRGVLTTWIPRSAHRSPHTHTQTHTSMHRTAMGTLQAGCIYNRLPYLVIAWATFYSSLAEDWHLPPVFRKNTP